jgi:hypothetical protein
MRADLVRKALRLKLMKHVGLVRDARRLSDARRLRK